jgi:raffinose/stachyose/melibiose transport system permease protein
MGTVMASRRRDARKSHLVPSVWFAIPAVAVFAVVVLYPTIEGIVYSFTSWTGLGGGVSFTGLANYRDLIHNSEALDALAHTLIIAAVVTVAQNLVGLGLAVALNSRIKSRSLLRTILFAPVVMTPIVVGYMWQFIYTPSGALSDALSGMLGTSGGSVNFLGSPSLALWAVIIVIIWQYAGYSMAIFLAGLQNIPPELHEAAAMDGAGALKRFWWITRPMLRTAIVINLTLALVASLKTFDQVLALTQGGPGYSTQTLSTLLFNEAFLFDRYGFGMTLAVALLVLVMVAAFAQLRFAGGTRAGEKVAR